MTIEVLYKLTCRNGFTGVRYGRPLCWAQRADGEYPRHTAPGGGLLCTKAWLHAYTDPLVAMLLNPIHSAFAEPRLFRAIGEVGARDHSDLKVGCRWLQCKEELPATEPTLTQSAAFGILCAIEAGRHPAPQSAARRLAAERLEDWGREWIGGKRGARDIENAQKWADEHDLAPWGHAVYAARNVWLFKSGGPIIWAAGARAAGIATVLCALFKLDLPGLARQAMEVKE